MVTLRIAKWLSLFYVASLVTLPLALDGLSGVKNCFVLSSASGILFTITHLCFSHSLSGDVLAKILAILAFGMVGTLVFTAQTTVWIRALVQTPNKEVVKAKPVCGEN